MEIGLASLGAIMRCLCCIYELELHLACLDVIIRYYVVCSYIYDLEIILASLGKIIKCLYDLEIGLVSLGAIMRCLCCIYELELHLACLGVIIRCYVVCSYIYDLEILLASLGRIIIWKPVLLPFGAKRKQDKILYAAIITY